MDNSYELAKLLRDNIYCISLKEKEENRKAILIHFHFLLFDNFVLF